MQRSPFTLWLALVAVFWGVQCNSLSDDCKKTLTCGDAGAPELNQRDCVWRFPDGGVWTDGPHRVEGRWEWPNGEPAPAFVCEGLGAGGSGGVSDNCTANAIPEMGRVPCDAPLVCDEGGSNNCVQCLTRADCTNAGDAAAYNGTVCDSITQRCVTCVEDRDCSGNTPVCFIPQVGMPPRSDITRAECVECKVDADCGGSGVCDQATHECTLVCSVNDNRCPSTKPVCDPGQNLCVECLDNSTCTPGSPECNTTTKECVQCTTNAPCTSIGQVCDLESASATYNRCVECVGNQECTDSAEPQCETTSRTCVECLTHENCTDVDESRCNVATHTCATCNNDNQCEVGLTSHCRLDDGKCVQCTEDAHCGGVGRCDMATGNCVECLTNAECLLPEAARCDQTLHECVGCLDNLDCSGRNLPGLCRDADDVCVACLNNSECRTSPATSLCGGAGACVPCTLDTHCDLFENFQGQDLRACKVAGANAGCVECTTDDHCATNPDGLVCKLVDLGNADGPQPINTCVECIDNSDCIDPAASKCEQNQCVPCTANGDCDIPGRGVCDLSGGDGVCVQCTGPQRQACGSFVCDSRERVCSTTEGVGSAVLCESCISDAHCAANARCIEQSFGTTEVGFFCFPLSPAACVRPYVDVLLSTTIDDVQETVCLLRETTCAALNAYGVGCAGPDGSTADPACGVPALPDGICAQGPLVLQCTIPCQNLNDCPSGGCANDRCSL